MYGTIARFQVKPGMEGQLETVVQGFERSAQVPPGLLVQYVYRMDADPSDWYLVVVFESREAYVANANSAEQGERYQQFRELLVADPEWHDGAIVNVLAAPERVRP